MDKPRQLWSDQDPLTPKTTAIFLGGSKPLSLSTLSNWRRNGEGPEYIRVGKSIRYPLSGLNKFIKAMTVSASIKVGIND